MRSINKANGVASCMKLFEVHRQFRYIATRGSNTHVGRYLKHRCPSVVLFRHIVVNTKLDSNRVCSINIRRNRTRVAKCRDKQAFPLTCVLQHGYLVYSYCYLRNQCMLKSKILWHKKGFENISSRE